MGTTPIVAIPYVEPTDLLANYPTQDKAQADRLETIFTPTTWTTTPAAGSGAGIRYVTIGKLVIVQIDISLTTVSGTITNFTASPVPAAIRPPFTERAFCDFSGWPGGCAIGTDGVINGRHQSGANRSNVSATLIYMAA